MVKKKKKFNNHPLSYTKCMQVVNSNKLTRDSMFEFKESLYVAKYECFEKILNSHEEMRGIIDKEINKMYKENKQQYMTDQEIVDLFSLDKDERVQVYLSDIEEYTTTLTEKVVDYIPEIEKKYSCEEIVKGIIRERGERKKKAFKLAEVYWTAFFNIVTSMSSCQIKEIEKFKDTTAKVYNTYIGEKVSNMYTDILVDLQNRHCCLDLTESGEIKDLTVKEDKVVYKQKTWKELHSLAEEKGWSLVRCRGDHGIYKHPCRTSLVVIPQGRPIGKGLQLLIERSL